MFTSVICALQNTADVSFFVYEEAVSGIYCPSLRHLVAFKWCSFIFGHF